MDKKSKVLKNSPIGFKIPQMENNNVGLRKFEKKFSSTEFSSPMFGSEVKDETISGKTDTSNEVVNRYDVFREEKKISNETLIKEHGTIYPEFIGVEQVAKQKGFRTYPKESESINHTNVIQPEVKLETNSITEVTPEPTKQVQPQSFSSVVFENPKQDYSSQEQKLPPFFFKKGVTVNETKDDVEEIVEIKQEFNIQSNKIQEVTSQVTSSNLQSNVDVKPQHIKQNAKYVYPPLSLFKQPTRTVDEKPAFLEDNKRIINETLEQFNIDGKVESYTHGPSVTRYEIRLGSGVNVKKIPSIQNNIKMQLSAKSIRIEAPIPGKDTVGIEVPNLKPTMVHYYDIINDSTFKTSNKRLLIGLGKDIEGNVVFEDIASMPHGLIAGATSSGKSVCVNTLLISLLLRNSPDELKLILVDPKRVELMSYDELPHLVTPVIIDPKMASQALKWSVDEMEKRYNIFTTYRVRNIAGYNDKATEDPSIPKLPFLLIVIDELADLMSTCGPDVEESIQRITQKARAAGIHLLVATQRPTTDVVKGTIKANIPSRIAFKVAQGVDSQTILDQIGAEDLLGKGDMFIKSNDGLKRVQGAYIPDDDIDRVTGFIKDNNECNYIFTHEELKVTEQAVLTGEKDDSELYYNAALFFIQNESVSVNALQQSFCFGFNKAAKVVETLEKMGIVSPKAGTLPRKMLVTKSELDEMFNM